MRFSNYAFWAGVSFLALFIFGFYGLGYVPSKLFNYEDTPASLEQILAHKQLLRHGITASVLMNVASLFLGLFIGLWLRQYSKIAGNSAALLLWTGALISLFNESNSLALIHWSEAGVLQEIEFHLKQYRNGIYLATIFWGLWLLPPALTLLRKNGGAQIAGILLLISGLGYLYDSSTYLLMDKLFLVADYTFIGELVFTVYLLLQKKAPFAA